MKSYSNKSLLVLGRQPELGLTELESLYGAKKIVPIGKKAAVVDAEPDKIDFSRLGGSTRLGNILGVLDTTDWRQIEKNLLETAPSHSKRLPDGKMTLGLSVVGLDIGLKQLEKTGLTLKKVIRTTGRPVRLVPNKAPELNAAQVIHNKLTKGNGMELVFVRDGKQTILAQTTDVQDIDSYTQRDRGRPKRDAKVGMLPPKLAQIIINLAVGPSHADKIAIFDPFCGTGVVLQEALLMNYSVSGSDIDPRMVAYSEANLNWLKQSKLTNQDVDKLEVADATTFQWQAVADYVASETYLGRPFTSQPSPEILSRTISECNLIIKKFLQNIHEQLPPSARLCLAVPAWRVNTNNFQHLPLIDELDNLGYNRVDFEYVSSDRLIYHRPDQIVARKLLVLKRK